MKIFVPKASVAFSDLIRIEVHCSFAAMT